MTSVVPAGNAVPTSKELREMIRGHVKEVSGKMLSIIGRGLWSLQWSGQITFDDLDFEEGSQQALLVSRMNERNIRSAVTILQDALDAAGYDYEFDVTKMDQTPFFSVEYSVELRESDSDSSEENILECSSNHLGITPSRNIYNDLFDLDLGAESENCSEACDTLSGFDLE